MSALQDKYLSVVSVVQSAGIYNLQIQERNRILYISGNASNTSAKDGVWNML